MVVKNLSDQLQSSVDLKNVKAPIITLLSIAGMIIWATTSVWNQKQELKESFSKELHMHIEAYDKRQDIMMDKIEDLLLLLNERQKFLIENIWTQRDHFLWCRELERMNPTVKCPDDELRKSGLIGPHKYTIPGERDRDQLLRKLEKGGIHKMLENELYGPPKPKNK